MALPFITDYAKSNESVCRGCETTIDYNTLRLAIMDQSNSFDGKVPFWFHYACFFIHHMPKTVADISDYDNLRWKDQKNIENIIKEGESPYNEESAKEINVESARKAYVETLSVEYSKTGQCPCVDCSEKIPEDVLQITEEGKKNKLKHFHLDCFSKKLQALDFWVSGEELNGYETLKPEGQVIVKEQLVSLQVVPRKKQRLSEEFVAPKEEVNKILSDDEKSSKNNSDLLHEYRANLKKQLNEAQLEILLKYNQQIIPKGYDKILDRASEMMVYGALGNCPSCQTGQLSPINNEYTCSGCTPWAKCTAITKDPIRNPVHVPEELKILFEFLMDYEYEPREKIFKHSTTKKVNQPLNYLNFTIIGYSPEEETQLKRDIVKLGGHVVSHVKRSVLAVVTTKEELARHGSLINEAEQCQIYVVSRDFINVVANISDPETVKEKIKDYDMSKWGAESYRRVPPQLLKNDTQHKHLNNNEGEELPRKIRVKNGLAIEPDANLDKEAHVYQRENEKYTAVLIKTDIGINQNAYYKIQLLESDDKTKYWIFRSWGRTGTNCKNSVQLPMEDLTSAIICFENLFREKTGNSWSSRENMEKKPGLYTYVEVDYEASKEEIQNLETPVAESALHPAVAHLIAFIFNINSMEKLLLEYSLDTQKMPLGKLSKYQIKKAYSVLGEAISYLSNKSENEKNIVQCTNQFYSLMPYNSALKNPPRLDHIDIIKTKLEMLESLYEMETAFCMIQRNVDEEGNPLDAYYKQLCTDIELLDKNSEEYPIIQQYVTNTHADTHRQYNLQILDVFKVNRQEEPERFKNFSAFHNRKLLWHGSRTTNFAGILSQGLRIAPPEAPPAGAMFGKGVYFADMVSKSANYCCICADGTESEGLLLLCEVALGNVSEKLKAQTVRQLPQNVHSVKGVGKTAPDPKFEVTLSDGVGVPIGKPVVDLSVRSDLQYNEYIVYDIAQVKLRYLLKIKFEFRKSNLENEAVRYGHGFVEHQEATKGEQKVTKGATHK